MHISSQDNKSNPVFCSPLRSLLSQNLISNFLFCQSLRLGSGCQIPGPSSQVRGAGCLFFIFYFFVSVYLSNCSKHTPVIKRGNNETVLLILAADGWFMIAGGGGGLMSVSRGILSTISTSIHMYNPPSMMTMMMMMIPPCMNRHPPSRPSRRDSDDGRQLHTTTSTDQVRSTLVSSFGVR